MADKPKKKPDPKRTIPLRSAGEKINSLQADRPSARLFAEVKRLEAEKNAPPTTTHRPPPPPTTNQEKKTLPISPQRDFTKFANSIVRDAIPSGLFKGTSKNTYDALYQRTRGAIEPKRKIKAIQSDVLRWSNVSHNTLRTHLKNLEAIGLIKIHYRLGDNEGAEYEVFLPEEIGSQPPYHPLPPPTTSKQELGPPTNQNLVEGGGRFNPEIIDQNTSAKTYLKTNTKSDDEPYGAMLEVLNRIVEKVTGKTPTKGQSENWKELAELLAMELELSAARTKSVSNAPAFLTEHLRRRLMSVKKEVPKPKQNKTSQIGSQQPSEQAEAYKAEPLSEEGRASTLKTFLSYIEKGQKDFLMSLQDTYTKEDWDWLTSRIDEDKQ